MCLIDYGDPADVWSETHPRAKRPYRCAECGREIATGERHLRLSFCSEGSWSNFRTCAQCEAAGQWLKDVCGGWLSGAMQMDLEEHYQEHGRPVRSIALLRLIRAMQRRWRARDGGLIPVEAVARWAEAGAKLAVAG